MGQNQDSLISQLNLLSDLAKNEGMKPDTISRILHGNLSPLEDVEIRSELIKAISLAHKEGLYDAADFVRYKVLGLK